MMLSKSTTILMLISLVLLKHGASVHLTGPSQSAVDVKAIIATGLVRR